MPVSESKPSKKLAAAAEKLTDRLLFYPSFRPEAYYEMVKAFQRMVAEFGEDRVSAGLTAAIDSKPEFPPTPAEIRQSIPRTDTRRTTCQRCADNEGFELCLMRPNKITGKQERAVKICDHRP